jgi:hypothetical protein
MKMGGVELQIHVFFVSECKEISGQFQAQAATPPWERAPGTHWIGVRVVSTAGMNTTTPWFLVRKRTIPIERSPPVSEASANFSG